MHFAHAVGTDVRDLIALTTSLKFAKLTPCTDLRPKFKVKRSSKSAEMGAPRLRGQPASHAATPKPEVRGQAEPN